MQEKVSGTMGKGQILKIVFVFIISLFCTQCKVNQKKEKEEITSYSYSVNRAENPTAINSLWNKEIWEVIVPIRLQNYMGKKPSHFPEVKAKLTYDETNIYVVFKVSDQYVKAVAKETNGKVWLDSCVEFFFSPGPDTDRGYFNFEANCKGVFLFQYHTDAGKTNGFVSPEDCKQIEISHSLKRNVEQEITEPVVWYTEYSIPVSILGKYMHVEKPDSGVIWRANFYKCADNTSHPHWLTWAPVDYHRPKFHMPEFFGELKFE